MKKPKFGLPEKNLGGIPWRLAFALQDDGWILRNDMIWHKPNPTPGGQGKAFDRFTVAHEYVFFLSKKHVDHFDGEAVRTETNARPKDVWTVATAPTADAHFATYPPKLIEPCIGGRRRNFGECTAGEPTMGVNPSPAEDRRCDWNYAQAKGAACSPASG